MQSFPAQHFGKTTLAAALPGRRQFSVSSMARLKTICLIALFLNTWAGSERFPPFDFAHGRTFDFAHGFQAVGATPEARGTWVARQIEDRESPADSRIAMRMRLFDRQDRMRERALTMTAMEGGAGKAVPGDRSLIRFTYPNDIKGTAFLVWKQPTTEDERFLYLPALARVRRIAGSEAQESFVGSDFTYEDFGGRRFEDYSYKLLEGAGVPSTWTAPDGAVISVYALDSRHKDPNARFPHVVSLVRKDHFIVVHAEIRNKRDEIQKTYDARKVEKTSGYWTVLEMRMTDSVQRTRTELALEKVEYNVGLKPDDFSRRELERGGGLPRPVAPAGVR